MRTVLTSGIVSYVRKYRVQNVRKLEASATTATLRFAKNVKRKRNIALNVVHHAAYSVTRMLDIAKFVTVRSAMDAGLSPSNVHTALRCIKFVYRVFLQTTKIVSERSARVSKILTIYPISLTKSKALLCSACYCALKVVSK